MMDLTGIMFRYIMEIGLFDTCIEISTVFGTHLSILIEANRDTHPSCTLNAQEDGQQSNYGSIHP